MFKFTEEQIEQSLKIATNCNDIIKWQSNPRCKDHLFLVPVSLDLPWELHYEVVYMGSWLEIHFHNEVGGFENLINQIRDLSLTHPKMFSLIDDRSSRWIIRYKKNIEIENIVQLTEAFKKVYDIINPIVQSYLNRLSNWLNIISDFTKLRNEEQLRLPFNINLLDEVHVNENAHTRILLRLLNYNDRGTFPILSSFLKMIGFTDSFDYNKTAIDFNWSFIDGFISDGTHGIIIENKINWAVDQDRQIERYVNTIMSLGLPKENIYVLYLTDTGDKKVEDYSLTPKAKEWLSVNRNDKVGRFIGIDYKHNILPWLKTEILPSCKIKDILLLSALNQYIDYLEGRFEMRERDIQMNIKLRSFLFDNLKLPAIPSIENYRAVNRLVDDVKSAIVSLEKIKERNAEIWKEIFVRLSEEYFRDILNKELYVKVETNGFFSYVQIRSCKWNEYLHLEWYPLETFAPFEENKTYTLVFHNEMYGANGQMLERFKAVAKLELTEGIFKMLNDSRDEQTWFKIEKTLESPFISLTIDEQKKFIFSFYDVVRNFVEAFNRHYNEVVNIN